MSLLASVSTGKITDPQINLIIGTNGVGKTTWATSFPKTICADLEDGSKHLKGFSRLGSDKFKTLDTIRTLIKELATTNHGYETFVLDSIESLESLICDEVCREGNVKSIEAYDGGYGKGFTRTREIMREILLEIQGLQKKGITTNLVAHTQVKTISDPTTNQSYDRVIMRTNDKMAAVIRDLSDNVFFATYKVFTTKENNKLKAYGDGQRVMYTQWRPGFDAKNRLELPFEIPLSYESFIEACKPTSEADLSTLISEIAEMSKGVSEDLQKSVKDQVEKFKSNPTKLKEIKNRLMSYVSKN